MPPCDLCISAEQCLSCIAGYRLDAQTCRKCPVSGCRECSASACQSCIDGFELVSSGQVCACAPPRFELGGICLLSCPVGFYPSGDLERKCQRCPRECTACLSDSVCLSCLSSGYHLVNGRTCQCRTGFQVSASNTTCVAVCPLGFYGDSVQRRCLPCDARCVACLTAPDHCTACQSGFYLKNSRSCVPSFECIDGLYPDTNLRLCAPCEFPCGTKKKKKKKRKKEKNIN